MNPVTKRNTPSLSDLRSYFPSKRARPDGTAKHRRSSSCPSAAPLEPSAAAGLTSPIHDTSISAASPPVMCDPSVTPTSTSMPTVAVKSLSAIVAASVSASRQAGTVLTVRKLYQDIVHARYPHHQPASDFELYALGCNDYSDVAPGELSACLAQEWSHFVTMKGNDVDVAMTSITTLLGKRAEITGVKPLPGDPDVSIISIPKSPYALRMWPGSLSRREYCVDFVHVADPNTSVNVPQGYSLSVKVPMGSLPWLGVGIQELHSIEDNLGVLKKDMKEGSEKFVVLDGVQCILTYPTSEEGSVGGKVWFKVPVRPGRKVGNE